MKRHFSFVRVVRVICVAAIFAALTGRAGAQTAAKEFVSRDANIDGTTIHYTTGDRDPRSYSCMGLRKPRECGIRSCRYSVRSSP